jgi:tetratricopeptide (TPR) repeat protein
MRMHAGIVTDPIVAQGEFRAAAAAAFAAGDDRTAAWSLADGALSIAEGPHLAECDGWLELARGVWTRLGRPPDIGNRIEAAEAECKLAADDTAGALAATRREIELSRRAFPHNDFDRADDQYNLARALAADGRFDEAQREVDAAIALGTKLGGAQHPMLAEYYLLAAEIVQRRGHPAEALEDVRKQAEIAERWYGPNDAHLAKPLHELGDRLALNGQVDEARRVFLRALALAAPGQGRRTIVSLARLEEATGHHARAIELASKELADMRFGPDTRLEMHSLLVVLGTSHRELGHLDDSERALRRALDLLAGVPADQAGQGLDAQVELAYTLIAEHRAADAARLLEPSLARSDLEPLLVADLHVALGRALWEVGERQRARREVEVGRATYLAQGDVAGEDVSRADAWLRSHGGESPR